MEWREDLNQGKDLADTHILKIKHSTISTVQPIPNPLQWQASNDQNAESRPYVTHMAFLGQSENTSASAVEGVPRLRGHTGGITSLKTEALSPSVFWSSGVDGTVKKFDLRTANGEPSAILRGGFSQPRSFMSLDISPDGNTIVAGTDQNKEDASIVFWDIRNASTPSTKHTSTHSEDITTLTFHSNAKLLLSGAMDGLISITNVDEPDEDEAVVHVVNWNCSVSKVGWIGGGSKASVWSTSDMETMALWSDELDLIHEYGEIKRANIHNWYADYVVSTQWIDPNTQGPWGVDGLVSWWGTNEGNVSHLSHDIHGKLQKWSLRRILKGGHKEIVRCICWENQGRVVATGGEDGQINLWPASAMDGEEDVEMMPNSPDTTGARRRKLSGGNDDHKALKRQRVSD